ncbi:MAG: VTT domain-containing protein [Bacteroidota bacterium]
MKAPSSIKSLDRTRFLVRNLLRGFLWLIAILTAYVLAKRYLNFDIAEWMGPLYDQPVTIFSIFFGSEVIFGIIPPEFFMLWSLRHGDLTLYVQNVVLLAVLSYTAGVIGYFVGAYFNSTPMYRLIKRRFLGKAEKHFNRFGGFLVVVAALTPLPFSGICMLMGAVKYELRNFLWLSLTRFIRFSLYAFILWESHII